MADGSAEREEEPLPGDSAAITTATAPGTMPNAPADRRASSQLSSSQPTKRSKAVPYLPAVDGLRAFAVVAVMLYHFELTWLPGGFLGVDVFFVISGYLITSQLIEEWRRRGRIDVWGFWQRRARRLFPAVFLLLGIILAYVEVFLPDEVTGLRSATIAALAWVTNWYFVFDHMSYFEAIGRPPLLRHLWSLAIEEQFYVVWPLLFIVGMRLFRLRYVLLGVLAAAIGSTALMAILYVPDVDPSRLYYGTDTHAVGLLIGSALALVWTAGKSLGRWRSALLDAAGLVALGLLVVFYLRVDQFQPFVYQGGFAIVALTTAVVIAAAASQSSRVFPLMLGSRPLTWLGERSYGFYLWHWPIYMLTRPQLDVSLQGWSLLALRLVLITIAVQLSYTYVETPIRHGALGNAWRALKEAHGSRRWRLGLPWVGATSLVLALGISAACAKPAAPPFYLAGGAYDGIASAAGTVGALEGTMPGTDSLPDQAVAAPAPAPEPTTPVTSAVTLDTVNLRAGPGQGYIVLKVLPTGETLAVMGTSQAGDWYKVRTGDGLDGWTAAALVGLAADAPNLPEAQAGPLPPTGDGPAQEEQPATPAPAVPPSISVTAIGDSVMLGAVRQLDSTIGNVEVDAVVGRQMSTAISLLRARRDAGQLGDVVVVQIGNNGPISARQFAQMMEVLADVRRVVLVNFKVPREWEAQNNAVLAEGVGEYPNAVLIDWHTLGMNHPEYFWNDGIHLRPEGAEVYAQLIADAINAP